MNLKFTLSLVASIACFSIGMQAQSANAPSPLNGAKKLTKAEKEALKKSKNAAVLSNADVKNTLNASMNTVYFIPNEGQLSKKVLYSFNTPQAQLLVFKDKIRLIAMHKSQANVEQFVKSKKVIPSDKHIVDISFSQAGALNPIAVARENSPTFNYFTSSGNTAGLRAASELRFDNIYEGITLRLYSNAAGSLEFDWLVNNPVDYKKINMRFEGEDKLNIDNDGSLDLGLHFGNLKIKIPETYQVTANGKRTDVKCHFALKDNTVSYAISSKLHSSQPLVIDPVLTWGSYMDGNNTAFDAYLFGGDVDASGNYYIAGASEGISYNDIHAYAGSPAGGYLPYAPDSFTDGSHNHNYSSSGSGVDWLIMKIAHNGASVLAYTFFGLKDTAASSSFLEQAHCIQVSPDGKSIFVGGQTSFAESNNAAYYQLLPAISGGLTNYSSFGGDSVNLLGNIPTIAVFSPDLTKLKYRTILGDGDVLNPSGGQQGDISSIEPLNETDFIVAGYVNKDLGSNQYGTSYTTLNTTFGGSGGSANNNDIYIAKFTSYNHLAWGTYIGGDGDDFVFDMRPLSTGDLAFCGSSASTNTSILPALVNEVASTSNRNNGGGINDGLAGIIKADGSSLTLLSKIGGAGNDQFNGLETGNCDTIFVVGQTQSIDFPNIAVSGVLQGSKNTGTDMVLFKFPSVLGTTTSGYGTYFGGTGNDIANSIAYLPVGLGELFIFGTTTTSDTSMHNRNNIPGNTFFKAKSSGGSDIFFLECSPDFKTQYLGTYLGGADDDYLGKTGVPVSGKQMRLVNDSNVAVFTTTHSMELYPRVIGNLGVNSFDSTKNNTAGVTGDCWTLFALNIKDVVGQIDAGDAPQSYGKATVKIADNGHRRALLTLGKKVDGDFYYPALPGTNADADDKEGLTTGRKAGSILFYNDGVNDKDTLVTVTSDEDALAKVQSVFMDSGVYTVHVPYYNHTGTTASLYCYIDFDGNGVFEDATGEIKVHTSLASSTDTTMVDSFVFHIPVGTKAGKSYMRFVLVQNPATPALLGCTGGTGYVKNQALGLGEIEDYAVNIYEMTFAGTVYDDANGNTDVTVNGTPAGTIGGVQLYAYLIDSAGNVKAKKTLPAGGTFSFGFADGVRYYDKRDSVVISPMSVSLGAAAPSTTLPANLVNTGENFGLQNAGSGNDPIINGSIIVKKQSDSTSITGINYGIDQLDTAFNKSYSNLIGYEVEYTSGNGTYPWKIPLNSTQNDGAVSSTGAHPFPGRVSGHDPEDGRYAGATGTNGLRTFEITSLPNFSDAVLTYSTPGNPNILLVPMPTNSDPSFVYWSSSLNIYEIPNFNADSLSLFAKSTATSASFTYAWRDLAFVTGSTATYSMSFSSPLPVELTDFTATKADRTSLLNWSSATEQNLAYYLVERSIDGVTFEVVGQVAAKGNSVHEELYSFTDNTPTTGTNYYRLRLVDKDNSYKYSSIRTLNFDGVSNGLKVYPNPTTGAAVIALVDANRDATGTVSIYNMLGEQVSTRTLTFVTGTNRVKVSIDNLPAGFYQVKVMMNDQLMETKIEVIR